MFDLYLITEPEATPDMVVAAVQRALKGVPRDRVAVQLRSKQLPARELWSLARELRRITTSAGAKLLINDRVDVAKVVEADGVHLPENGLPPSAARMLLGAQATIGVSCHDAESLARAAQEGADFAVLGPVFDVPNKAPALALQAFAALVKASDLPVFALGGVDADNASALIAAGARGVAVIRAVFAAPDPAAAVRALLATR